MDNNESPTREAQAALCESCDKNTQDEGNGRRLCVECYESNYTECNNCSTEVEMSELHEYNGDNLCRECYDNAIDQDEEYGGFAEREYGTGNYAEHQSRALGLIIRSTRIFSAEVECYAPSHRAYNSVYNRIPQRIGASGDGSLNDNGVEFQTPKLKGKNGEDTIKNLCSELQKNDFHVDRTTGLHIHLDGRGLFPRTKSKDEPKALKQLWVFYHCFEDVLHSFLPNSRVTNRYCKPLRQQARLMSVEVAKTLRDLEKVWYKQERITDIDYRKSHKYDDSRYCGVNLHSLLGAKHLEIRYHSGTLNAVKILHWANLHLSILDKSAAKALPIELTLAAMDRPLEDKTEMFFNALGLSEKSRKYFMRRQKQFSSKGGSEESIEANDADLVCAA